MDSESEATAYLVADNRLVETTQWDDIDLAKLLRDLRSEDQGLALAAGFEMGEIDALITKLPKPPSEVTFQTFDEDVEKEVVMFRCPKCSHQFPTSQGRIKGK